MSVISAGDTLFMKRALRLAARARGQTSPNPMVGAVVVKQGRVIAEDYHKRPGELHAEALALQRAGEKARRATLYVTLEPCCHTDKRTPPCTGAIVNAGVAKVVVAMVDPNPKVSGKGIVELRKQGIQVIEGVCGKEAKSLNEVYIKHITTGLPFVTLKVAMTLDGKIATPRGQSKWITGERARLLVHKARSSVDAILTGAGTVKADDPELTVRLQRQRGEGARNPGRIVIDPDLETPLDYRIFDVPPETLVVTKRGDSHQFTNPLPPGSQEEAGRQIPALERGGEGGFSKKGYSKKEKLQRLLDRGVKVIEYEGDRIDLKWLMKRLGAQGITSVLIEAGSSLNASALHDGIVDKVMFFIAPKIIGGRESFPAVGGKTFRRLEDAYAIRGVSVRRVGEDILIEGYLASPGP